MFHLFTNVGLPLYEPTCKYIFGSSRAGFLPPTRLDIFSQYLQEVSSLLSFTALGNLEDRITSIRKTKSSRVLGWLKSRRPFVPIARPFLNAGNHQSRKTLCSKLTAPHHLREGGSLVYHERGSIIWERVLGGLRRLFTNGVSVPARRSTVVQIRREQEYIVRSCPVYIGP